MLFPQAAIEILCVARWSAEAERVFEIFSGGFCWSDEGLREVAWCCSDEDNYAYRYVIGYRASLIQGKPRLDLREPWEQLKKECPDWPGFRAERCDPALAEELEQASQKALDDLEELDRKCNEDAERRAQKFE